MSDSELLLSDEGLQASAMPLTQVGLCTSQTVGAHAGEWCPFGYGGDQADDQAEDDRRSLTFDTPALAAPFDILGAPAVTLAISSDKPSRSNRSAPVRRLPVGGGFAGQLRYPQPDKARWVRLAITIDARASLPCSNSAQ